MEQVKYTILLSSYCYLFGMKLKLTNILNCVLGVHVYRIERSVKVDKIRSPWVVKRLRGRLSESGHSELIAARLKAEAEILR